MASQQKKIENLTTLLFSIEDGSVMLPDVAVAEIIDFQVTEANAEEMPVWYLGDIDWRGLRVPVVSLESMNHGSFFSHSHTLKIIVINRHGNADVGFDYWGFVALETPKLQRINPDSIVQDDSEEMGEVQLLSVELLGEPVIIPDLKKIEANIAELDRSAPEESEAD